MAYSQQARRTTRRIRIRRARIAGLLAVIAAIPVILGYQWPWSSSHTLVAPSTSASATDFPRGEHRGAPGDLSRDATVFDDESPAITNLDPDLLGALRQAATEAAKGGVEFVVDSGWRSPEYQERLLREAVLKYGSEAEAARWVATPDTSAHVSGDAVDIGPSRAAEWLSENGARYGLCQIYGNEPWHYELRPEADQSSCPAMYADPTHDPRMQQK